MNASYTRRSFVAQLAAAAFSSRVYAAAGDSAPDRPLITDDPLERLVPRLQDVILQAMLTHSVPGLSVALIRDAQIAWTSGFGVKDKESADPVDADTVFEAASLTKPLLAYAALGLCEQGRLKLDEPLAPFLEEPFTDEQTEHLEQVTARHVLTHTTGFPNWRARGRSLKFLRPPGNKFSYSGEGFVYLQRVVERLTDQPLTEYLGQKLFAPLGMTSASLVWRDAFEQSLARGYPPNGKGRGMRRKFTEGNAASSLVCTASDYARFVCALWAPPKATEGLLSLNSAAQLWKPQVEVTDGVSWGLGIGVEHTPVGDAFWHWGNNGSRYNCFFIAFPEPKVSLVVFTNSGNGLKACTEIVPAAIGGDHPALRWKMVVR